MTPAPAELLERKRAGLPLDEADLRTVVRGATDGSWDDGQLAAFLMAAAIRGLDAAETGALTRAMLDSGERWDLAAEVPQVVDKHSTGGLGDKTSLLIGPLLAVCGVPVAMLTGRALGHTGGTADKLESIPGLDLELDRRRCLELLRGPGLAIGVATAGIAPADRRLYALRHRTGTVDSLPLIAASIVSKKLAVGAAAIVFDVKVGNGAFLPAPEAATELAHLLVSTCAGLGRPAGALLTDMSQPLGEWLGHAAEVRESVEALAGHGRADVMEVTLRLAEEAARQVGRPLQRSTLDTAISSGAARERFEVWARAQGAEPGWLDSERMRTAPEEVVLRSQTAGVLAAVDCRRLGRLAAEAAATPQGIDRGVAFRSTARLGDPVERGGDLGRLYLRRRDPELEARVAACFTVAPTGAAPELFRGVVR